MTAVVGCSSGFSALMDQCLCALCMMCLFVNGITQSSIHGLSSPKFGESSTWLNRDTSLLPSRENHCITADEADCQIMAASNGWRCFFPPHLHSDLPIRVRIGSRANGTRI